MRHRSRDSIAVMLIGCAAPLLVSCGRTEPVKEMGDDVLYHLSDSGAPSPSADSDAPGGDGFILRGSTVLERKGPTETPWFTGAFGIRTMRRGPDGSSFHFLLDDMFGLQARCADSGLMAGSRDNQTTRKPPASPWTFGSIGHAGTIDACGQYGRAGGYLVNAPYFAYVKVDVNGIGSLTLEELSTQRSFGMRFGKNDQDNLHKALESEFMDGVRSDDGSVYYYPHEDATASNGKIVLGIGPMILAVDAEHEKLMGTEVLSSPPYNVVATSYWFQSSLESPFVVLQSGWEGSYGFEALLDLSGGALVLERLSEYPNNVWWGDYDTEFVEWQNRGGVTLHFYGQVDITDQVSDDDLAFFEKNAANESMFPEINRKNAELERKLRQSGEHIDVDCDLVPGIASGCYGLTEGISYTAMPGEMLKRHD